MMTRRAVNDRPHQWQLQLSLYSVRKCDTVVGPSKLQADTRGDPNLGIKRIHHELGYSNNIGLVGKANNNH